MVAYTVASIWKLKMMIMKRGFNYKKLKVIAQL